MLTAVAIAFTLCSMTSALQMTPPECAAWDVGRLGQGDLPRATDMEAQRALCLA